MRFEARMPAWQFALELFFVAIAASLGMMLCVARKGGLGTMMFGVFLLVLALVGLLVALASRPRGRATLVLDEDGLDHALQGAVGWNEVLGIQLKWVLNKFTRTPILVLGLEPHATVRNRVGWLPSPGESHRLALNLRGLDQTPERILAVAQALRDRVEPPSVPGWRIDMSPELLRASRRQAQLFDDLERHGGNVPPTSQASSQLEKLARELVDNSLLLGTELEADQRRSKRRQRWALFAAMLLLLATLGLMLWRFRSH